MVVGVLLLSLVIPASAGATVLPSTISENTTLTPVGNPYTGTSTIKSGVIVTVEPGVKFVEASLFVNGTLDANGSAEMPIVFKGNAGSAVTFQAGSGASVLDHIEIIESGSFSGGSSIKILGGASPAITNSTIRKSKWVAIWVKEGGSPNIAGNHIFDNEGGAILYSASSSNTGEVKINNNLIEGPGGGIEVNIAGSGVSGKTLSGNSIIGTKSPSLRFTGSDIPGDITQNTLSANATNVIEIGGTVAHSSVWKGGGSTVSFRAGVTVASGVKLEIQPGVEISETNFTVNGTLDANGSAEMPIVFKGNAGSAVTFQAGSGASVLDHIEIIESGSFSGGSSIKILGGASPAITNSTIRKSKWVAIWVKEGGSPNIAGNHIFDNEGGAILYSASSSNTGEVKINNNLIEGPGGGIEVNIAGSGVSGKTLSGNSIIGTKSPSLRFTGSDIPGDITQNTLEGNSSDEILLSGTVRHSATWTVGNAPVRFAGTVTIPAGVTLNLQPGIYIRSPKMTVYGTLDAEGSATHPVVLTGASEEKSGEWSGINLESGSGGSSFNYVEFGFGGSGGPMLNVKGVSPTITNSTFRRSSGDAIRVQQSGHPTIEGNRFRNNQFGLRYEGEGKLAAPRNDWGCANGPKPAGCGDQVTSNVEWHPAVTLQELPRLCPGTTELASFTPCLLQKYEPQLRFDSEENYYADSAAEITDNWGDEAAFEGGGSEGAYTNALVDADEEAPAEEEREGRKLAESAPGAGGYQLTLSALGTTYPDSHVADSNDWLEESNEYVRDAHRLEEAGYMNAAYGMAFTDALGKRWLEYWYWYYYNPKSFEGIGVHEGDWESVLVGLDPNNRPEEVILSQHTGGANCYIGDVETTEAGGPVVYVAVDSHANYPKPGSYDAGFVTDYADGGGPAVQPGLVMLEARRRAGCHGRVTGATRAPEACLATPTALTVPPSMAPGPIQPNMQGKPPNATGPWRKNSKVPPPVSPMRRDDCQHRRHDVQGPAPRSELPGSQG